MVPGSRFSPKDYLSLSSCELPLFCSALLGVVIGWWSCHKWTGLCQ